jgi:hypothetical protein
VNRAALLVFCLLAAPGAAIGQEQGRAVVPVPPVADPDNLLPAAEIRRMAAALQRFHARTGRYLAVVVARQRLEIRPGEAAKGVGVVVAFGMDNPQPRLLLTDPKWLAGAPKGWAEAVAGVLESRFRHQPFVQRTVMGVSLLARVLPDKLAFMERPARKLSDGSIVFSQWAMGFVGLCVVIGYLVVAWRGLFDYKVGDAESDPAAAEIRRLREGRSRW